MSTKLIDIQWMCPSREEAERVGKMLIEKKLVACVNIVPQVTSLFKWEGKIEKATELLMQCKTTKSCGKKVVALIEKESSYEVPAIYGFELPLVASSYQAWVESVTRSS